jgi:hypothetical protein
MRLPGDLPVLRGRWLLLKNRPPRSAIPSTRVSAHRHPALAALTAEAAKAAGLDPPPAVALGGTATVSMRHEVLLVGLPLVWGLPADQLRSVMAHELALPPVRRRHRRLVRGLLELDLDGLKRDVEQVRDAAAIDGAGGGFAAVEDAALAILRAESIRVAFDRFAAAYTPSHVADLHAGWHAVAELGVERLRGTDLPELHPGLADELLDAAEESGDFPGLDPDAVPIEELTDEEARELSAQAGPYAGPWTTFAELPISLYADDLEQTARRHLEAVEQLLGGPPTDLEEVFRVLLYRAPEILEAEEDATEPDSLTGPSIVADVIEYTLIKKGGRRVHPAVPWRIVNPDGRHVDLRAARHSPERLFRLLSGEPEPAA